MFNVMFKGYPVDTAKSPDQAINRLIKHRSDSPENCSSLDFWTIEEGGVVRKDLTQNLVK